MTDDIRYYAITCNGRQLLKATNNGAALTEVEESYYLRKTTKRIVREVREVVFEQDPDGFLVPAGEPELNQEIDHYLDELTDEVLETDDIVFIFEPETPENTGGLQ